METLRELRFDHSYTQKMLADEAGITRHAVLRMEDRSRALRADMKGNGYGNPS